MNWSPQQAELFRLFVGPLPAGVTVRPGPRHVLVRARAGTGKTTSIVELVRQVLARWPRLSVVACAFNKEIATELEGRLPRGALARTLHSLGLEAQQDGRKLRVDTKRDARLAAEVCGARVPESDGFTDVMLVPKTAVKLVRKLFVLGKECAPLAQSAADLADLQEHFDLVPDAELEATAPTLTAAWVRERAYEAMVLAAEYDGTIAFSDMVYRAVRLNLARPRFDLVIVDEAQDMNPGQLILAMRLVKPTGRVLVVGDDRQGIYAFRGAATGALDDLKRQLEAAEVPLTVTRRCPRAVVRLAAALVPDFTAAPDAPEGEVLELPEGNLVGEVRPGDFVLSRTNAPLLATCLRLIARGVPAQVRGKDVGKGLSDLVTRSKAKDLEELERWVEAWSTKELKRARRLPEDRAERLAQDINDKADALRAVADAVDTVPELLTRLETLFSDAVGSGVLLSTVHKAKGLEADRVFLLEKTFTRQGDEEDNIRYVALTRAKRCLTLVTE